MVTIEALLMPSFLLICRFIKYYYFIARLNLTAGEISFSPHKKTSHPIASFTFYLTEKVSVIDLEPYKASEEVQVSATEDQPSPLKKAKHRKILLTKRLIVRMVTYFGILITYGIIFPILGVVVGFTAFLLSYLLQIDLGRSISTATNSVPSIADKSFDMKIAKIMNTDFEGGARSLKSAIFIAMVMAPPFYAFFLFDTLGDEIGLKNAIWTFFSVPLIIVFLYFLITKLILPYYAVFKKSKQKLPRTIMDEGTPVTCAPGEFELNSMTKIASSETGTSNIVEMQLISESPNPLLIGN
jgi:hypothetical protein